MRKINDLMCFALALNVIILSCLPLINAHVALTYPPARKYDLDFLDNSRTKGPCGMPKGKLIVQLPKLRRVISHSLDLIQRDSFCGHCTLYIDTENSKMMYH